ncbi:hypothetical protein JTE90_007467 [Oedothorax gibbosus]|uniref:MARVEL domain-containing protein n=1 Tax=Oedothorax gibbosus TaxID=931172 RepID=A0AAV6U8W9_9ARAC|nr:hypothetical protein JTE90_007467 [Oedothorax gibbosus]
MSVPSESVFSLNVEYLKSKAGILRISEATIALCGLICESQIGWCMYSSTRLYNYVVLSTIILSLSILVLFAFQLDKIATFINWPISVFLRDVVSTVLYLIATILMMVAIGSCIYGKTAIIFAAMFGVCGTVVVGTLAFFNYLVIKGGRTATTV